MFTWKCCSTICRRTSFVRQISMPKFRCLQIRFNLQEARLLYDGDSSTYIFSISLAKIFIRISEPTQICPTDSHPYLIASSHQPLRCIPHHEFDNCPSKFVCSLSGYCCSSISSSELIEKDIILNTFSIMLIRSTSIFRFYPVCSSEVRIFCRQK